MKIRLGFVSNYSSSSFCIYGKTYIRDIEKIREVMIQNDIKLGIEGEDAEDASILAVGLSPEMMKDDETAGEFKRKIERELMRLDRVLNINDVSGAGWIIDEYSY